MSAHRTLIKTLQFLEFYDSQPAKVQEKIDYVLLMLTSQKIVSSKFIKRLESTELYEMRVSLGNNEYRSILLSLDSVSFIECTQALLLNGFVKKDTKQYKTEIDKARNIIKTLED